MWCFSWREDVFVLCQTASDGYVICILYGFRSHECLPLAASWLDTAWQSLACVTSYVDTQAELGTDWFTWGRGELQEYMLTAFVPASWVTKCSYTQGMSLAKHVWGWDQIRQPIIFLFFLLQHVNSFPFSTRSRNSRMYDIRSEWILICYWWNSSHRQYGTLEPLTTGTFY